MVTASAFQVVKGFDESPVCLLSAYLQPTGGGFDYSVDAYVAALGEAVEALGLAGAPLAVVVQGYVLGQCGLLWALENEGGSAAMGGGRGGVWAASGGGDGWRRGMAALCGISAHWFTRARLALPCPAPLNLHPLQITCPSW